MMKAFRRKRLGEILIEMNALTQDQLAYALDRQRATQERLGVICLSDALISDAVLAEALAQQFGLEHVDLQGFKPDEGLFNVVPPEVMYRYHFIPLELQGEVLV